MLTQFCIQYGLNGMLPARAMDHGKGRLPLHAVLWRRRVRRAGLEDDGATRGRRARARQGSVPLLHDADGKPLKRNFVHVDDLVAAILLALDNPSTASQLYNICMDEPVDYGAVADYLKRTRNIDSIEIPSQFHSNWMDNSKAKYELGWRPRF